MRVKCSKSIGVSIFQEEFIEKAYRHDFCTNVLVYTTLKSSKSASYSDQLGDYL